MIPVRDESTALYCRNQALKIISDILTSLPKNI